MDRKFLPISTRSIICTSTIEALTYSKNNFTTSVECWTKSIIRALNTLSDVLRPTGYNVITTSRVEINLRRTAHREYAWSSHRRSEENVRLRRIPAPHSRWPGYGDLMRPVRWSAGVCTCVCSHGWFPHSKTPVSREWHLLKSFLKYEAENSTIWRIWRYRRKQCVVDTVPACGFCTWVSLTTCRPTSY